MKRKVLEQLRGVVGAASVYEQEPMKKHTSFRIGGPAEVFAEPETVEELVSCIRICRESAVPWTLIGNGSNLLVSDEGLPGVVLQTRRMNRIDAKDDCTLSALCGASLSAIARFALDKELTGLEFASGIPGTLGGAVVMNAGAYGGEMKDVVQSVCVLTPEGEVSTLDAAQMAFGYRTSRASTQSLTVLSACLHLSPGNAQDIAAQMSELNGRRREKQPLDKPSAGSTFKRPEGHFAGKLIMDAGLAGYRVGGAAVSAKHCGFVVNEEEASASDVFRLICDVQRIVLEKYGIALEPEVKMLGRFEQE